MHRPAKEAKSSIWGPIGHVEAPTSNEIETIAESNTVPKDSESGIAYNSDTATHDVEARYRSKSCYVTHKPGKKFFSS